MNVFICYLEVTYKLLLYKLKKCSVNTIEVKIITRTSETYKNDTTSINILHRYKNRSKDMS